MMSCLLGQKVAEGGEREAERQRDTDTHRDSHTCTRIYSTSSSLRFDQEDSATDACSDLVRTCFCRRESTRERIDQLKRERVVVGLAALHRLAPARFRKKCEAVHWKKAPSSNPSHSSQAALLGLSVKKSDASQPCQPRRCCLGSHARAHLSNAGSL